jgi:hypothetical protein
MQCVCALLSSVACPALQYITTSPHKVQDFREKKDLKTSVLIFSTIFSETFLFLRKIRRDMIINVHRSSCKVHVILVTI